MTGVINRLLGRNGAGDSTFAYDRAMAISDDLIARMQKASRSNDAARAVMADIWAQRNNIPYITTTFETAQELNAPIYQDPNADLSPKVQGPKIDGR